MAEYLTLFIGAVVVNNFVLTKFLGLCIFFGISKNLSASVGMGMAVTSVMTMSSILAWIMYFFVLQPLGLTFLTTIVFVVLTASFVQLLELIIKKQAPALYNMWGIYLLLNDHKYDSFDTEFNAAEWQLVKDLGKMRIYYRPAK